MTQVTLGTCSDGLFLSLLKLAWRMQAP